MHAVWFFQRTIKNTGWLSTVGKKISQGHTLQTKRQENNKTNITNSACDLDRSTIFSVMIMEGALNASIAASPNVKDLLSVL